MNTAMGIPVQAARPGRRALVATALILGLAGHGCATFVRRPLPTPMPSTHGATPVPGRGVGLGVELGDGLGGQELLRKELLSGHLLVGLADRVELGVAVYGGHEDRDPAGTLFSGKVRLGAPLGPRTSTALRVGLATVSRSDGEAQNESLTALDLALPVEFLLGTSAGSDHVSLYAGPRLVHEHYRDDLRPIDTFDGWLPGGLGGVHLQVGHFHLFGEGTMAWRPATTRQGVRFEGGAIFLPSLGIVVHLGSPFRWGP